MSEQNKSKDQKSNKGFWSQLLDKLDKKIEEKSKKSSCCGPSNKEKGSSCC